MTTGLQEGWTTIRVGDFFDSWGGMTPSTSNASYWGGKVPWVSSKDIKAWRIAGGEEFITRKALQETRLRLCPVGSVLVVVRSGILAHTLPIAVADAPVSINQDLKAFYCPDSDMNKWLALSLRSLAPEILSNNRKDGTTVQSVRYEELCDLIIQVAPSHEQRRITARLENLLGKVESTRERLSRVPATLKRFRQAVLAAAYSGRLTKDWREQHSNHESATELVSRVLAERVREYEDHRRHAQARGGRLPKRPDNLQRTDFVLPEALTLHEIPEAWSWVSVRDVVLFAQYGTSVKADSTPNQGVPILRMGNIQDGQIDLTSLKYITRESEDISEFTIAKGDILFNRTNSPELVGKTAIYDSDLEAVFASYLIRLRCDQRVAHSGYLSSWINSPWGKWWARTVRTDGVSQSNINATTLQTMPLPLPPLHEQEEIVQRINALLALSATIEESVSAAHKRTDKLTQSILAKAFRGELVPTEAELARREGRQYEPASVLLERIRKDCQDRETSKQSRKAKVIAI
jgi:type I restriction enzyme S subunit